MDGSGRYLCIWMLLTNHTSFWFLLSITNPNGSTKIFLQMGDYLFLSSRFGTLRATNLDIQMQILVAQHFFYNTVCPGRFDRYNKGSRLGSPGLADNSCMINEVANYGIYQFSIRTVSVEFLFDHFHKL